MAFRLEPDLEEGRGGLRDVHALHWTDVAQRNMLDHDRASVASAYAVLLDVRVELQRLTGRPGNVLSLQDQEPVARTLRMGSDEQLMRAVAGAARAIAWTSDDTWRRIRSSLKGPSGRVEGHSRDLGDDLDLRDGEVHLGPGVGRSTTVALRAAVAAAEHHGVIERSSLERLAAGTDPVPDAMATGPAAWGPGKSRLIGQLVERVALVLSGRTAASTVTPQFPSAAQLEKLAVPGRHIEARNDVLTTITDDRLGVFSRVAGVLALHGLDVSAASAYSSDDRRALSEFRVADPVRGEVPWPKVLADIELGLDGRLAIPARLAERARTYARAKRSIAPRRAIKVTFDDDASTDATVLDVQAPDAVGALYRITRVFGDLDIDIRSARVQTMGTSVVDSFYIRDSHGRPVTDRALRDEIERAVVHSLSE